MLLSRERKAFWPSCESRLSFLSIAYQRLADLTQISVSETGFRKNSRAFRDILYCDEFLDLAWKRRYDVELRCWVFCLGKSTSFAGLLSKSIAISTAGRNDSVLEPAGLVRTVEGISSSRLITGA